MKRATQINKEVLMRANEIERHKKIMQYYIRAKDDNKPHMMQSVFTDSATLEMKVKSGSISFPASSIGLNDITNVLVRNFSQTYENVYTFCLSDSLDSQERAMSCDWLVGMSERDGGNVRIGCGRYDWTFNDEKNPLANHLTIIIEQMLVFTPEYEKQIMEWLEGMPYPFCDSETALQSMPDIDPLKIIRNYI
jgi:hypothetical protein